MLAADGWSRGRPCTRLSSLCRSCVFIASIAVIIVGVHGIVGWLLTRYTCLSASASLPVFPHQDRRSVPGLVEQREYSRAYR